MSATVTAAGLGSPPRTGGDAAVAAAGSTIAATSTTPDAAAVDTAAAAAARDDAAPTTRDGRRAVVITTAICATLGVTAHVVLLIGWLARPAGSTGNLVPWQPVVGGSLAGVALVAFGGFYVASLRARVALMSSFMLTFLLLLIYVLTVREVGVDADNQLLRDLLSDFRVIVQTIVAFYFGTETVLSLAKIVRAPKDAPAAARRADRDLPAG